MRVLITRPREDGEAIAVRLTQAGHQPLLAPLLAPRWFNGPPLDLAGIDAVLATSANGVRALIRRTERRDVPIFAVGPQTTEEARAAGFTRVENADGDAKALAAAVPRWLATGTLLHVCGEQNEGALAETLMAKGYAVRREILYVVEALFFPEDVRRALEAGKVDAALFFSPRSARVFMQQAGTMPLQTVSALCISPATATVLPAPVFRDIRVAAKPNQDALLALLD
jgi:uroporphyrinogen-III synthase